MQTYYVWAIVSSPHASPRIARVAGHCALEWVSAHTPPVIADVNAAAAGQCTHDVADGLTRYRVVLIIRIDLVKCTHYVWAIVFIKPKLST